MGKVRYLAAPLVAGFLVPAALAGCGGRSSSTADPVTLRFADQLQSVEQLLHAAGQDTGFGYPVHYANFLGGPAMLQAFQAGSVDAGFVADTPLIFAQAAHQPVVAVAGWATQRGTDALVTAPGSRISSWRDLKGKRVAYQQGTVLEAVLLQGLHSVGLSLKDVVPANLTATSIPAALERGSVDAVILVEPLIASYLQSAPTARVVATADDLTDRSEFIVASTSTLRNPAKRAALLDFVRRVQRAVQWANANPAAWAQVDYVQDYHVSLTTAESIIRQAGASSFFPLPGPLAGPQQALANLYTAAGELPSAPQTSAEFSPVFNTVLTGSGS